MGEADRRPEDRANAKRWFARDDPVDDLTGEDSFGHAAYAETLADAILRAEPPFTIGVFGDWGVGKTTISRSYLASALARRGGKDKIAYAYFDVWKYEEDSLRRQFLRDVATQLKEAGALKFTYNPAKELKDLVVDVREFTEKGIRISWRRAILALLRGAVVGGAVFLALRILDRLDLLDPGNDLAISLLAALITASASELGRIIVVGEREVVRRSIDAPDLFEEKFRELMDHVKTDRVVIVIDNLDRCASNRVVEVLSTIKTFLEPAGAKVQPIFVIPCDREAIHRHLEHQGEMEEGDADEYLRKFFGLPIRITPILEEEIRVYATRELERLSLGDELTEKQMREVTQIVGIAFRENPRRVKQFFNTLTSKLMLIREREAAKVIDPPISSEIPFLAKLTVIEEEWPEFYEAIQTDVRAFDQVVQLAVGVTHEPANPTVAGLAEERLKAFLRGTRPTVSQNVRAFTRLKLSPTERQLRDYWEFRNALVDGRLEDVERIVADVAEENQTAYREAVVQILKEEIANGYFEAALSVTDAAIRLAPLRSQETAGEIVEQLYSTQGLRALLPSLAPYETILVLRLAESDAGRRLSDEYLVLLGQSDLGPLLPAEQLPKWQLGVVRGLRELLDSLSPGQVSKLREMVNQAPLIGNVEAMTQLIRSEEDAGRFLTPETLSNVIGQLTPEHLKLGPDGDIEQTPVVSVWLRSLRVAGAPAATRLGEKATELLDQMTLGQSMPPRDALMGLLVASRPVFEDIGASTGDQLIERLVNHYQSVEPDRRWQVIAVVSGLYSQLSSGYQPQAQTLVTQFATSEPITSIEAVLKWWGSLGPEGAAQPLQDALWNPLKGRFTASGNAEECGQIANVVVAHAATIGWGRVQELFHGALDVANLAAVAGGLSATKERIAKENPDLLPALGSLLVDRLPTFGPDVQVQLLTSILLLGDVLDDDQRRRIRDHAASLICSEVAEGRARGLEFFSRAREGGLLKRPESRHVVEQVVIWLVGRAGQLEESYRPVFDLVVENLEGAESATIENVIGILKGLLPRAPTLRSLASDYFRRMTLSASQREEVVRELVHWAKQEGDPPTRHAILRNTVSVAGTRRRGKAWKELETYLKQLEEGAEPDRALATELLKPEVTP